ncbi:FRMD7 protein, partial [Thinocorus orbignyianus]|nr:FRMD7 protein [Thinocorus orbignyianus]
MKTIRFPFGSEFRPLGPCPALSSRRTGMFWQLVGQQGPGPGLWHPGQRYVGSSSECSDSDPDLPATGHCSPYSRALRAPMARARLSSGSLQLDEEDEEVSFATGTTQEKASWASSRYFT